VCLFEPEDASLLQKLSISRKLRIHNVLWNSLQIEIVHRYGRKFDGSSFVICLATHASSFKGIFAAAFDSTNQISKAGGTYLFHNKLECLAA